MEQHYEFAVDVADIDGEENCMREIGNCRSRHATTKLQSFKNAAIYSSKSSLTFKLFIIIKMQRELH